MKNIVICLLLFTAVVFAQQKQRVAVLPSVGDLDPQRLILLTDKVREIATKNLPMENFNILKQDVITKLIGEEELYRSCKEGVCIGDLAKKTNANYGARCDVIKLDDGLVMKFELYSVNEEAIFETFTDYGVKDFHGMLAVLEARLPDVFKKMADAFQSSEIADSAGVAEYGGQAAITPEPAKSEPPPVSAAEDTAAVQPTYKTESLWSKWVNEYGGKSRILQNRVSIEFDMGYFTGSGDYGYSYDDAARAPVRGSVAGGRGPFGGFRLDLKYFEGFVDGGVLFDYGDTAFLDITTGYIVKYPFVFNAFPVKVTPVGGYGGLVSGGNEQLIGAIGFIAGGRIDVGISNIAYLRSEYLMFFGSFEGFGLGQSLKAGGGVDMGFGTKKKAFLRAELLYRWVSVYNSNYTHTSQISGEKEQRVKTENVMRNVDIKAGIGYKWGGVKKVPAEVRDVNVK